MRRIFNKIFNQKSNVWWEAKDSITVDDIFWSEDDAYGMLNLNLYTELEIWRNIDFPNRPHP